MSENANMVTELLASMQSGGAVNMEHTREAVLIRDEDLPWVNLPDGSQLQVLHVDLNQNLWVVRNRFKPGFQIDTHYHTGPVFAFTQSGEWFYSEYPDKVNTTGSYLFEPAHSVHTLTVSPDATEDAVVAFAIFGSNVNVDTEGNVTSILDAQTVLFVYQKLCEAVGADASNVLVVGSEG